MKIRTVTLALACAALLGGCATKDYVNEQIASVNKRMDSQQADTSGKLSQTASLYEGLENRVNSQQTALEGVSRTAQEALDRATAAGKLAEEGIEIPYDKPYHELTAVQRDVLEMEAQIKAAWLLTLRAASMIDHGERNNLEASMAKAKAGKVVTWVTQKAVEILGPLGYSREWLVEKWMRDAKINDIYEGTGQINTLIVARRILGYSSKELR